MKKFILLAFLFLTSFAGAQNTTVNATVVDSDGTTWANGSWNINFQPNNNFPNISQYKLLNGASLDPAITQQSGTLNGSGVMAVTVYDSSLITPTNSGWSLTICPKASASCGIYKFSTSGASMDISANLTTAIPPPRFNAVAGAFGYTDGETIITIPVGATYFNVVSQCQRVFQSGAWGCPSTAGGSIAGQAAGVIPLACAPTSICNQSALSQSGGVITSTNDISVPLGAMIAKVGFGSYYAKQCQTGGGNNGIGACVATNATVIADPSYASTEVGGYSSLNGIVAHSPSATRAHVITMDNGQQTDFYMNPAINTMPWNAWHTGHTDVCTYTTPDSAYSPGTGNARYGISCNLELGWYTGPAVDFGAAPVGPVNWQVQTLHNYQMVSNSPGITEGSSITLFKESVGDNTSFYNYPFCAGGTIAAADEGCEGFSVGSGETSTTFTGTVSSVTDEQHFKVSPCATDCGFQGDGRYITNTVPVLTSFVKTHTAPSGNLPGTFLINDAISSASTFWGTISSIVTPVSPTITGGTSMTFTATSATINGAANVGSPVIGDLICFNGQFHEQARITNVTGSGPWSVTALLRHAHNSGSVIMANGPCGTFINFIANQATINSLKFPIDIIGATDTTHLQYAFFSFSAGTQSFAARAGNVNLVNVAVSSLSNTAGLVSMGGVNQNNPQLINAATITISGASDAAFNGACTNTTWNGTTLFCTQAGSIGHTAGGVTGTASVGTTGSGNGNFTLLNGAEVLDVQNYNPPPLASGAASPPIVDGTFLVEPNGMGLIATNTVELHHHYSGSFTHEQGAQTVWNPMAQGAVNRGRNMALSGSGIGGGNYLSNVGVADQFSNGNSFSMYAPAGGTATPFGGMSFLGPWQFLFSMLNAPMGIQQPLIYVGCPGTPGGCNDYGAIYYPFMLSGQASSTGAAGGMFFRPASNEMTAVGNWVFGTALGSTQFNDNIVLSAPTAPTPTFTQSAINGTLGAGTYCYRVAVRNNAGGPGIPGTEACSTFASGTTNSLTIKWTRQPGATLYYVYGRTTGAELQMFPALPVNQLAVIDDGSVTPAGALPATAIPPAAVTGAQFVSINSPGTAFNGSIKAPSLAGAVNWTMPSITATIPVAGTCTNQAVTGTSGAAVPTCSTLTSAYVDSTIAKTTQLPLSGTTATIGGGALTPGACVAGTVTVTGATTSMVATASPSADPDSTLSTGIGIYAFVSSANTVTVRICAIVAVTPTAVTYNVRVIQ